MNNSYSVILLIAIICNLNYHLIWSITQKIVQFTLIKVCSIGNNFLANISKTKHKFDRKYIYTKILSKVFRNKKRK